MYQQLLKSGADDLRQDAVMEQLFELVNTQLAATSQTRHRQLHVRTYNVVPLTPAVGLVINNPSKSCLDFALPNLVIALFSGRVGSAYDFFGRSAHSLAHGSA